MQKALGESAEFRKLAISLKAVEYGGELTEQLLQNSGKLEKLYESYIDLKNRKVTDNTLYQTTLDSATAQLKWFEKAKACVRKHQVHGLGVQLHIINLYWLDLTMHF